MVSRQFVVVAHEAPTTDDFSLSDLTGSGRLDLLARCVTASLLTSHGMREDVRTHLVLDEHVTIEFDGASLQGLNPDERSTAALIRNALGEREEAVGHIPVETSPGVSLYRRGLEETLETIEGTVLELHPDGMAAGEVAPPEDPCFVLSDHRNFSEGEAAVVAGVRDDRVSLGPVALHADHAIVVSHNWLDTAGFGRY